MNSLTERNSPAATTTRIAEQDLQLRAEVGRQAKPGVDLRRRLERLRDVCSLDAAEVKKDRNRNCHQVCDRQRVKKSRGQRGVFLLQQQTEAAAAFKDIRDESNDRHQTPPISSSESVD